MFSQLTVFTSLKISLSFRNHMSAKEGSTEVMLQTFSWQFIYWPKINQFCSTPNFYVISSLSNNYRSDSGIELRINHSVTNCSFTCAFCCPDVGIECYCQLLIEEQCLDRKPISWQRIVFECLLKVGTFVVHTQH